MYKIPHNDIFLCILKYGAIKAIGNYIIRVSKVVRSLDYSD